MKKLLILLTTMLFGITASFAQVDIVNVSWDYNPETCTCETELAADYFKITVSIYDNANSEWVVQNRTVTEINLSATDKDVDVPEVSTYCGKSHDYTISFTVYAWVWLIDDDTNPVPECCSKSNSTDEWTCHDFYNDDVPIDVGTLE